eukprot:439539_1
MASEHWPTYVVLSVYVLATILVTVAANIKNNDPADQTSHISKHFLASKNFGTIILTFTTFASVFSGYTVVGVPNEAGSKGFFAIRWMALIIVVGISMLWLYPRLRRLSIVRGYLSPGDFIEDRFKSKALSILVALCMCVPQILYIGINLYSLGSVVDGLTGGELGFYPVVIASTIMILLFEGFGGMRSVAYTDAVEAVVMVAVFIIIPILMASLTGGFIGMVNNSQNLKVPCDNSSHLAHTGEPSGCLNYATNGIASEYFLRSPSSATITNYVLFIIGGISFALNPHITQRALSGKTDRHVRFVIVCIFIAGLLTMTPGILTGIAHISTLPELKEEYATLPAFQAMLAEFRDYGGFVTFFSYIALLAGIAGIMSTADSALIGVSNTLSCDIFKNWFLTQYRDHTIVWVGKGISLFTMSLCLIFAIVVWETGAEYGVVYTIQQGLLWQAVPAYVFGLYTNLGTHAVLSGTVIGTVIDLVLIGIVFGGKDPLPLIDKSWSTLLGVAINVCTSILAHYCVFKGDKSGNHEDILSLDEIRTIMQGITEPITHHYGALFWLSLIVTLISAFHWMDDVDEALIDAYGLEEAKGFMYNGRVRHVIGGLPDYIFATLMWYLVAIGFGIAATMQWGVSQTERADDHSVSDMDAQREQTTNKSDKPQVVGDADPDIDSSNDSDEVEMGQVQQYMQRTSSVRNRGTL